jgi:hypothetical protein
MGKEEINTKILVILRVRDYLEDEGVDGRIILKRV